jgi:hypothetical protein
VAEEQALEAEEQAKAEVIRKRVRKMVRAKKAKAEALYNARAARVRDMLKTVNRLQYEETITVDEVYLILARIVEDQQAGQEAEAIGFVPGLALARDAEALAARKAARLAEQAEHAEDDEDED